MHGLVVRFELVSGQEHAFDQLVAETLPLIERSEAKTLAYVVHRVESEPSVRLFYELYQDVAAFEEHERQPHVQRFLAERGLHLRQDPEVSVVEAAGGLIRDGIALGDS